MNTILQVPISKELRNQAVSKARKMGFSSLQETVRVFLNQFASNKVAITFQSSAVKLSKKNDGRYAKMISDIESGKVKLKSFSSIDKMIAYLNK